MCPDCGSLDIIGEFHCGRMDPETGYDDSGPTFRCRDCGATGDAADALARPARIDAQRATFPAAAGKGFKQTA